MIKAVNEMQSKRFLTRNELYKLEKYFLMYGEYDVQTTDGVIHLSQQLTFLYSPRTRIRSSRPDAWSV